MARRVKKKFGLNISINWRVILGLLGSVVFLFFMAVFYFTAVEEPHTVKFQPDNAVFAGATVVTVICCAIRKRLMFILPLVSHALCIILGSATAADPASAAKIHCIVCAVAGLAAIWLNKLPAIIGEISDGTIDINSMIGDEYSSDYDGTES